MIIFRVKAVFTFLAAIFIYKFGLKKISPILFQCGANLFKVTYRIPETEKKNALMTIRIFKRILFEMFAKRTTYIKHDKKSSVAIFDGNLNAADIRKQYIENFANEDVSLQISKDDLLCNTTLLRQITTALLLTIISIPVFLIALFSKNRSIAPLIVREYLEVCRLNDIVFFHEIKKMHHFCIFEIDSNICSYLLMNEGIYVNKIPSEVPLYFANRIIVSDSLSFCFAYQEEEFMAFKESMFVKKTQHWGPELFWRSPKRFLVSDRISKKPDFQLGFYSSGNWLRAKLGDADLGHNNTANEELILKEVMAFANKKKLNLRIFLHPLEKQEKNWSLTEAYYREIISSSFISISERGKPSIESFDEINVAISMYSTLMFERIFLGFKTILAPWGYPEFPLSNSPLKNICAASAEELNKKLDVNLDLTVKEFFERNQISNYTKYLD